MTKPVYFSASISIGPRAWRGFRLQHEPASYNWRSSLAAPRERMTQPATHLFIGFAKFTIVWE